MAELHYEGNAVLHPRGSEYQTQFVVDGIPLTDTEIEADNVDSLTTQLEASQSPRPDECRQYREAIGAVYRADYPKPKRALRPQSPSQVVCSSLRCYLAKV